MVDVTDVRLVPTGEDPEGVPSRAWVSVPRRDDHIVHTDGRRWVVSYVEWHIHKGRREQAVVYVRPAWALQEQE